ncbi:hypothetical protein PMIN06_013144 [Paraphaeosphaeria minitans]
MSTSAMRSSRHRTLLPPPSPSQRPSHPPSPRLADKTPPAASQARRIPPQAHSTVPPSALASPARRGRILFPAHWVWLRWLLGVRFALPSPYSRRCQSALCSGSVLDLGLDLGLHLWPRRLWHRRGNHVGLESDVSAFATSRKPALRSSRVEPVGRWWNGWGDGDRSKGCASCARPW